MVQALLDAIYECGTIMSEGELQELAYKYGHPVYIEDADGNIVDEEYYMNYQAVADIYTDGFDCINF